jgi:Ca2+-binding EF-hand superfamily protein
VWQTYDVDGSGVVEVAHLMKALRSGGGAVMESEAHRISALLGQYAKTGEASKPSLSFDEFVALFREVV